jgi:hypothetical protein
MRIGLDIKGVVLKKLRDVQKREGGTLGSIASRLLAETLGRRARRPATLAFQWTARRMAARIDLADKNAVNAILHRPDHAAEP